MVVIVKCIALRWCDHLKRMGETKMKTGYI